MPAPSLSCHRAEPRRALAARGSRRRRTPARLAPRSQCSRARPTLPTPKLPQLASKPSFDASVLAFSRWERKALTWGTGGRKFRLEVAGDAGRAARSVSYGAPGAGGVSVRAAKLRAQASCIAAVKRCRPQSKFCGTHRSLSSLLLSSSCSVSSACHTLSFGTWTAKPGTLGVLVPSMSRLYLRSSVALRPAARATSERRVLG